MSWLDNTEVLNSIGDFLAEDLGRGDITTQATVNDTVRGAGRFLAKEPLVVCGLAIAEAVFLQLDPDCPELEAAAGDGEFVEAGTVFATMKGYASVLLAGERVALNLM